MDDRYISVLMIQARLTVDITDTQELCVFNNEWKRTWKQSVELIQDKLKPDIVLFPETFYNPDMESEFCKLSEGRLIVAGSTYKGKENVTVVFCDGIKTEFHKNNPSPLEVAAGSMHTQSFDSLVEDGLWDEEKHTYMVKGKRVIVLNCMEYYNSAYYLARRGTHNANLFGFVSPCSSSNMRLFEQETEVINNHKENVYSFVCNRISPIDKSTTKGGSYVYGAISRTMKDILSKRYMQEANIKHVCGIIRLDDKPQYVYGEYAIQDSVSPFGRSDDFIVTPKNLEVGRIV